MIPRASQNPCRKVPGGLTAGNVNPLRATLRIVAALRVILTVAAALCFTGCVIQMEVPMSRRQLSLCEAPPGSLIRTTKGEWFHQQRTGPKGGEKIYHPDVFLPGGTVLRVTRVTNYIDNWNGNAQPTEMQVASGPKEGTNIWDYSIISSDDPSAKTGFRYKLNTFRARLISRPPGSPGGYAAEQ